MRELTIGNKEYAIPGSLTECSQAQLALYCKMVWLHRDKLFTQREDGTTVISSLKIKKWEQIKIALSYGLLMHQMSWVEWNRLGYITINDIVNQAAIYKAFFSENLLISCPIPHFKFGDTYYYGPGRNFETLNFKEWSFTELWFNAYMKTGDESKLDTLCAFLYRKEKAGYDPTSADSDGDRREAFNNNTADFRIPLFAKVPHHKKAIIALWYRDCSQALWQHCPDIPRDSNQQLDNAAQRIREMMLSMSSKEFGPYESTEKTNIKLIMISLNKAAREVSKIKKNRR